MCICGCALACSEAFPFVFVHNREEVWNRETTDAALNANGVICGVDAEAGGTWMGLNAQSGSFAALTNVRHHATRPKGLSRGLLLSGVLNGNDLPLKGGDSALQHFSAYNLFHSKNVTGPDPHICYTASVPRRVAGDNVTHMGEVVVPVTEEWEWVSHTQPVPPGKVFCKSNEPYGELSDQCWPKVAWLQKKMTAVLKAYNSSDETERSGGCTSKTEKEAAENEVKSLLMSLEKLLSTTLVDLTQDDERMQAIEEKGGLDYTFYPIWKEMICHRGPFVRAQEQGWQEYGTRCQTIVISSRDCEAVYYCYRRTENHSQVVGANDADSAKEPLPWDVYKVLWSREAEEVEVLSWSNAPCTRGGFL